MLLGEKYSPLCVFAVLFLGPECAFCVSHVGTFCFEILYKWKVTVVDICVCVRVSNSLWKTSTPTILKYKIYLMEVLLETRKHVYGRFSLASSHGTCFYCSFFVYLCLDSFSSLFFFLFILFQCLFVILFRFS